MNRLHNLTFSHVCYFHVNVAIRNLWFLKWLSNNSRMFSFYACPIIWIFLPAPQKIQSSAYFSFSRYPIETFRGLIYLCKHFSKKPKCVVQENVLWKDLFSDYKMTSSLWKGITILYLLSWLWKSHGDSHAFRSLTPLFQAFYRFQR